MITPGRLPVARDDLASMWHAGLVDVLSLTSQRVHTPVVRGRPEPIPAYVQRLLGWLDTAELYWVSEEMTAVAVQAASALPSYRLHVSDIPGEVGLLVWARPVAAVAGTGGGGWVAVTGALWGPAQVDTAGSPGVHVVTLADAHVYADTAEGVSPEAARWWRQSPLMYHDEAPLPFMAVDGVQMRNEALAAVLSTWLLCGQRLSDVAEHPADRPVRRSYARAARPAPTVRQVTLRRAKRPTSGDHQPTGVEWKHRWVVRGYWRNTWYPSQERHKPQWIAEHVKGPDGAPLIGGEKINVLRR